MQLTSERKKELKSFLKSINVSFKNLKLLNLSLSHKSYINEINSNENNEKLEFLGDSVLGLVITDYLYKSYPSLAEGELARIKSFIVSEDLLSKLAKDINLNKYILIGKGEELSGGRYKKAILSDTYEAFLGAYYIDSNLGRVKKFILKYFIKEIDLVIAGKHEKDYKTLLQELCQKKYKVCPIYKLYNEEGPEHDKTFFVDVFVNNNIVGKGFGKSKKEAEKEAAKNAFLKLNSQNIKTSINKDNKKKNK